jgi:hypothetical protein
LLGFNAPIQSTQERRSFDFDFDCSVAMSKLMLKFPKPCFLRRAGRPLISAVHA